MANDNLRSAQELMDNYWKRDVEEDGELDTLQRIAETLTILAYAVMAVAEGNES